MLANGCIAHWKFNEGSGTAVADWVGGNDGTIQNPAGSAWSAGVINGAYTFDGVGAYLPTADFQSVLRGSFTISLWAKAATWPVADNSLLGYYRNSGPNENNMFIYVYHVGKIGFECSSGADGLSSILLSGVVLTNGQWSHIVCVANATTGFQGIYHNGVLVKSGSGFSGGMPNFVTDGLTMVVAGDRGEEDAQYFFAGTIDNVTLWNRALTFGEVEILYNNGCGCEDLSELDIAGPVRRANLAALPIRKKY